MILRLLRITVFSFLFSYIFCFPAVFWGVKMIPLWENCSNLNESVQQHSSHWMGCIALRRDAGISVGTRITQWFSLVSLHKLWSGVIFKNHYSSPVVCFRQIHVMMARLQGVSCLGWKLNHQPCGLLSTLPHSCLGSCPYKAALLVLYR